MFISVLFIKEIVILLHDFVICFILIYVIEYLLFFITIMRKMTFEKFNDSLYIEKFLNSKNRHHNLTIY